MAKGAVCFSDNDEYYTPHEVVAHFGRFDYDPATTEHKAIDFGIKHYDTIETDGLKADWTQYKRIWINPPFTVKHKFFEKAVKTYKTVHNEIYILVPIEFLTTQRFHKILNGVCVKLYIPNGRLRFENKEYLLRSPAFGSVVLKLQDKMEIELWEDYK